MPTGAITSHIDVALLVLYAFWIFFACLVFYLHREGKREGYPLQNDRSERGITVHGFPHTPPPKTFRMADGSTVTVPRRDAEAPLAAVPAARFPGAPFTPTGNPMLDGVGPASWVARADVPDLTYDEGIPKIVPLRFAPGFHLDPEDPDPRGMPVLGADGVVAGKITDAWVDRSEVIIRYLEAEVTGSAGPRQVLIPMPLCRIQTVGHKGDGRVHVQSILAGQFAAAPMLKAPDTVTLREEDRVSAYFGGGNLYATAARTEPLV